MGHTSRSFILPGEQCSASASVFLIELYELALEYSFSPRVLCLSLRRTIILSRLIVSIQDQRRPITTTAASTAQMPLTSAGTGTGGGGTARSQKRLSSRCEGVEE